MSTNQPVIKFSPFEALLIGEKNKILKRQPMKNTIFVRRINQPSKEINLRNLFGLENNLKKSDNEVVFKMPQRVRDFLRIRRLKNKNMKLPTEKKSDILCYEFEGQKMVFKNDEVIKPKKVKIKSNKVKFKKSNKENLIRKFNSHNKVKHKCHSRVKKAFPRVILKTKKPTNLKNKHLLRGRDGKFISKKEYAMIKLQEISPKQKYESDHLQQLYLKKNKIFFKSGDSDVSHPLEKVEGLPNSDVEFDIEGLKADINDISEKYCKNNNLEDFQFPNFPKTFETVDFDDDSYLGNLIYESFPKNFKFGCNHDFKDFSDALKEAEILKVDKYLKMYEKKTNVKDVRMVLSERIACIKLKNNFNSGYHLKNGYKSDIDEPFNKNNHLITGKNIGSLFFRSVEGKDIFFGDLVKPYFQNSWFGSLPEV